MGTVATSRASNHQLRSNRSLQLAQAAAQTAAETRGLDITILDMREQTAIFDYFVIVTGTSRRQLHGISEEIERTLKENFGDRRQGLEGYQESRWILLDYGDVVVHLFDAETREYYDLEQLWCASKKVSFEAPSPAPRLPK